jgi:hypothetical protein
MDVLLAHATTCTYAVCLWISGRCSCRSCRSWHPLRGLASTSHLSSRLTTSRRSLITALGCQAHLPFQRCAWHTERSPFAPSQLPAIPDLVPVTTYRLADHSRPDAGVVGAHRNPPSNIIPLGAVHTRTNRTRRIARYPESGLDLPRCFPSWMEKADAKTRLPMELETRQRPCRCSLSSPRDASYW